jgi:hypothetical protein
MTYQLILKEPKVEGTERTLGENVFLDDLQYDYKVYLFYYPGAMPNDDLEIKLQKLGETSGKNLFVNIGSLDDNRFDEIAKKFEITKNPVVIITGIDSIASLKNKEDLYTAYVRIDNNELFNSSDSVIKLVEELFYTFLNGEIFQDSKEWIGIKDEINKSLLKIKVISSLKKIGKFFSERDFSISVIEGKFEIKLPRAS